MKRLRSWLTRVSTTACVVPIARCVHYAGFRYGCGEYHPYESYLRGRVQGVPLSEVRERFVRFLQYYRPRHFGEALGIHLEREISLWTYPWQNFTSGPAWLRRPEDCTDILTHFSESGVPWSRIREEFEWLERALTSIREHGYQPKRFGSPILVRKFVRVDGKAAYLVLDGNHRLSALSALGNKSVQVRFSFLETQYERSFRRWYQVNRGVYSEADALRVFRAYFDGNHCPETTNVPAPMIGLPPFPLSAS